MSNFKFQKSLLAVSATAAMAGLLLSGQAHAQTLNTEKGSIDVAAKLFTSTCVLNIDTTASTSATAAKKTIDFGSFSLASVSSLAPTSQIGTGSGVTLSLKEATGGANCTAFGTGKWDIAIDLNDSLINTTNLASNHTLVNTTTGASAATGVAARLTRYTNQGPGLIPVLLGNKVAGYGYLLSGSTANPSLNSGDTVTLIADFYRLTTGTLAAGTYTANVPLTVVYR